jgi:hypothetical protein
MSPLLAFFLAIPILRLPPEIILVDVGRRLLAPTVTGYLARRRAGPGSSAGSAVGAAGAASSD